jgi:beta-mannanase
MKQSIILTRQILSFEGFLRITHEISRKGGLTDSYNLTTLALAIPMKPPFLQRTKPYQWCFYAIMITVVLILAQGKPVQALLGVYDPAQRFNSQAIQSNAVSLEHHFVTWRPDNADELVTALQSAQGHQRIAIISLESWPWNWNGMTKDTLLQDIESGRYDETIDRCLRTIQTVTPQKVLLRWGHEMEIINQYPWSVDNPQAYIAAYRHFVTRSHQLGVDNIIWVWSPAGNANAINYWPGEDVVDIVGISIYATPEWHPDGIQALPSFARLMEQKANLWQRWRKPVLVAEVGVNGSPQAQQQWLIQAIQQLKQFPSVIGWIYFNQIQPDIVPLAIGQPNWSLPTEQVDYLVRHWPHRHTTLSAQEQLRNLFER